MIEPSKELYDFIDKNWEFPREEVLMRFVYKLEARIRELEAEKKRLLDDWEKRDA